MENFFRKLCLAFFMCLLPSLACHADVFKGRIVNAETGEPIAGASVRSEINPQPGWSMQGSTTADSTGCFAIRGSWEGRIMFTFSMIGYKNSRKVDYSYGSEVPDTTDLGTIKLQPTALMLKEVEVTAKVPRITMSGDTIVFNPEAFKLKEGARLDELIKKLPGVENRDGQLYWNNKPIRLTMNGKNVFGGDNIIKQLPADVAEKLKLYNRKSELARHTGSDDGEEDQVLDIKVKPGFLDKWYGEVEAQYQTKKRYMFDVEASKLSDHDPQMVYAQANNTNRYIDRTMTQSMNRNIAGDGKSQYGSYNYQHNWQTKGTGAYDNNRISVSANFGHSDGIDNESQSSETFFPGKDRTFAQSSDRSYAHKLTPQMEARLFAYTDSVNTITVNAKATYEKARNDTQQRGASYGYAPDEFEYHTLDAALAAKPGDPLYERLIMRNRTTTSSGQQTRKIAVDYEWKHYLGKKGSFAVGGSTNVSGENRDDYTNRNIEYLREAQNDGLWQYQGYMSHDLNTTLGASFDYWIGKKVYISLADNIAYSRSRSASSVFADTDETLVHDGMPTTADAGNSMRNLMHTLGNTVTLKATINPSKAFMIMPKLVWTARHEKADYTYGRLDTTAVRTTHAIEPSLFLKWKMNRVRSMDLSFAYNTAVPNLISTLGYRNTVDPTSISVGNPLLGNSHSHTTTFGYHRMWLRKQIVLGLSASYRKDINPTATLYRYNSATGVYESKPMNVKGGDQWNFSVNYDQGFGVYFRLMNKFSLSTSQSYGFLTIVDNADPSAVPELNRQRLLGIADNVEVQYEAEKLRVKIYDRLKWNRYRYNDATYNTNPLDNTVGIETTLKLSAVVFVVTLDDVFRSGYSTEGMNGHRLIAAAYMSYSFLRNKCRLTLAAEDIFNKDVYYYSDYSAYKRTEFANDYIHHYANLTLSYRFDAKGAKKKGRLAY